MSVTSNLITIIESGLLAGHDNGFDLSDFLVSFFSMSAEGQALLKEELSVVIDGLSKTTHGSLYRVDGTSQEVDDAVWCERVKKSLRVFDELYTSNFSIRFMAQVAGFNLGHHQSAFYRYRLLCACPVRVVPLSEVFTKSELSRIRKRHFAIKQCYSNSLILADMFPDKVKYVEGETVVCGVPIEHAFNKVGDKYVDVTSELVLERDVREDVYTSLLEVSYKEAVYLGSFANYYGTYLYTKYKNSIPNEKAATV